MVLPGGSHMACTIYDRFAGFDLYCCTDPAQHLLTAGLVLLPVDDVDRHLSDVCKENNNSSS